MVCPLILAACGGGSSESTAVGVSAERAESGPVHGFVVIEERTGQRVVDAWFVRGDMSATQSAAIWSSGQQRCSLEKSGSAESAMAIDWQNTLYAGESIDILSRGDNTVSLLPQRYENAVVYATAERWLLEPLSDDAQLQIEGGGQVPAFAPVDVMPLTPLVRLQPADGVSLNAAQPVVWEASPSSDDTIELWVSAASDGSVQTVRCALLDSGEFSLPAVVAQALPGNTPLVYTLIRSRTVSHESGGAYLHVSQTSIP